MRNEKTKVKAEPKDGKTKAAKQSTTKPADAGKDAKRKGATAEAEQPQTETTTATVLRLATTGGAIETVDRETAVKDLRTKWTDENIEQTLFVNFKAIMSDEYIYAVKSKTLAKAGGKLGIRISGSEETPKAELEYVPDPEFTDNPEAAESEINALEASDEAQTTNTPATDEKPAENAADEPETHIPIGIDATEYESFAIGDTVVSIGNGITGELFDRKGVMHVKFLRGKRESHQAFEPDKWRKQTADDLALEKTEVIDGQVVPSMDTPLSETEKLRLEALQTQVKEAKDAFDNAPFVIGAALHEIRQTKLFRETHKEFGEYIMDTFGISREYGQELAKIAGFKEVFDDALQLDTNLELSVNAANAFVRDTNKMVKELGIGKTGLDILKPLIKASAEIAIDAATDKDGNVNLTSKIVHQTGEKLREIITSGTVTIEGKQMRFEDAKEQGLLNAAVKSDILESVTETIKQNRQFAADEYKKAAERQNQPVNGGKSHAVEVYEGDKPKGNFKCSVHGATNITSVGTGTFQSLCLCRWRIDLDSGELVCYEAEGKKVNV